MFLKFPKTNCTEKNSLRIFFFLLFYSSNKIKEVDYGLRLERKIRKSGKLFL